MEGEDGRQSRCMTSENRSVVKDFFRREGFHVFLCWTI